MYKPILILVLILSLHSLVDGNLTVCIKNKGNQPNPEENYLLAVRDLKEELTNLLNDNSSMFFDHLEFDFHHPALSMKGEVNNITVAHLDEFDLGFFSHINLTKDEIEIFKLTFKNISTLGQYNMTGNIGDLFDIWGAGPFWANVLNMSVSATTKIPTINTTGLCLFLDVKVGLESEESWFNGLMDDAELEEVINHSFAGLAPEAVEIIWGEIKEAIDGPLQEWIESVINGNSTVTSMKDSNSSQDEA